MTSTASSAGHSRTASLTVALFGVYAVGFAVLQTALAPLTSGGGPIAVAASTLAALAVFQPLRRRLQGAMDRRFNRSRYDAQLTVNDFAAQLRDEVDLERLRGHLRGVIGSSLAPASVGVWLRSPERTRPVTPDARGQAVSARRTSVVAIAWLVTVVCAVLVFAIRPGTSFTDGGSSLGFAVMALGMVSDATVGAVLTLKRPGNVVGLVLMLAAILTAITLLGWVSGAALTQQLGPHDFLAGIASLIGAVGFTPSMFVAGPLLALLFPNGRLPGPRWKWPVGATVAAIAIGSAAGLVHPGPIPASIAVNPLGASGFLGSEAIWTIGVTLILASLPVALVLAVAAVIVRVRRSEGVERAQLKWFVASIVAVGAFLALGVADGGYLGLAAGTSPTVFDVLAYASLRCPPIAVGVAILRYRLFEIDRIISRTLSWALVTGLLGVVFVGLVRRTAGAVRERHRHQYAGRGRLDPRRGRALPAPATTDPGRRGSSVQPGRYDAQRTTDAFSEQLRNEVDLARLRVALVDTVKEAVRPASATVWLRTGPSR